VPERGEEEVQLLRIYLYRPLSYSYMSPKRGDALKEFEELLESRILSRRATLYSEVFSIEKSLINRFEDSWREAVKLDPEKLMKEFERLFVKGKEGAPTCPPCEADYLGDRSDPTDMYDIVGLAVSPDQSESPSHIAVELEFMFFLVNVELRTTDKGTRRFIRELERRFLEEHLSRWVSFFSTCVKEKAEMNCYQLSSELLNSFIEGDFKLLKALSFG